MITAGGRGIDALIGPDHEDIANGGFVLRGQDELAHRIRGIVNPIHRQRPRLGTETGAIINGKAGVPERRADQRAWVAQWRIDARVSERASSGRDGFAPLEGGRRGRRVRSIGLVLKCVRSGLPRQIQDWCEQR